MHCARLSTNLERPGSNCQGTELITDIGDISVGSNIQPTTINSEWLITCVIVNADMRPSTALDCPYHVYTLKGELTDKPSVMGFSPTCQHTVDCSSAQ